MKRKTEFETFKFSRQSILEANKLDARNYSVVSKIYSDISCGYFDFSKRNAKLPLRSNTPDEHIESYKFLNSVLNISSSIFEAYKFLVTVKDVDDYLIEKGVCLKDNKEYPFKHVRNMLGYHYVEDNFYLELFDGIFEQLFVLEGKV